MKVYCFTCLYQTSKQVLRPDSTCGNLPLGQTFNDNTGQIEGCDSDTCNCSGSTCTSCKNSSYSVYPDFESCYLCGSDRQKSNNKCIKCSSTEYFSSSKICQSCSTQFQSCQECTESKCLKCSSGYGIDMKSGKCISCISSNKVNIGIYCIDKPNGCSRLYPSSIQADKQEIICDECIDSTYFKDRRDGSCYSKCPLTTFEVNGFCEKCKNNCQICPNLTGCSMCDNTSLIYQGQCISLSDCINKKGYNNAGVCEICPVKAKYSSTCTNKSSCGTCEFCQVNNGWYQDFSGVCLQCHPSCKTCKGNLDDQCTSCALQGQVLDSGKCVCNDYTKCLDCFYSGQTPECFQCKKGTKLNSMGICKFDSSQSTTCTGIDCCPKNYTLYGAKCKCSASNSNCAYCDNNDGNICQLCMQGYELDLSKKCVPIVNCKIGYKVDPVTRQCICGVSQCKTCNPNDGNKCDDCQYNYLYDIVLQECQCQSSNCSQCDLTNGKQCKQCLSSQFQLINGVCESKVSNCVQLDPSDLTKCISCQSGFSFNSISKKCECTIPKCINCETTFQGDCLNCQTGYSWSRYKKACICTAKNCDKCDENNGKNCIQCQTGYNLNPTTQQCEINCAVEHCQKCDPSSSGKSCSICANSNFNLSSTFICQCNLTNCKKCSSSAIGECIDCSDGYILDSSTKQCKCTFTNCQQCGLDGASKSMCIKCDNGYQYQNNQCEYKCQLNKCKRCLENSDICNECETNFSFNPITKKCECTLTGCQNCDTSVIDKCNLCNSGYTLDQVTNKCNCNSLSKYCKSCDAKDGNICKFCSDGYTLDNSTKQCKCQFNNCLECGLDVLGKASCLKCDSGYQFKNNQCEYICQLNKCKKCLKNSDICDQCETNFYFNSISKKCECTLSGCQTCDTSVVDKCNTCNPGFTLDLFTNQCSCSLKYCKTCNQTDGNFCSQCNDGYNWNNQLKKCEGNITNCDQMNASGLTCDKCFGNYIPNSTNKQTCECKMKACLNCDSNPTTGVCKQCQLGFEWNPSNNTCDCSEYSKCTQCDQSNGSVCLNCIQGFVVDTQSKKCKCSLLSCNICSTIQPGKCEYCLNDFILDASSGVCKCNLNNCQTCNQNDGSICNTCKTGYKWNAIKKYCEITIENCLELDSQDPNVCKKCLKDFKFNNSTKICECTLLNCKSCALNTQGQCTECNVGYKINANNPSNCEQICQDKNCDTCGKDSNKCEKCKINHTLSNQSCKCSIQKCKSCSITDLQICDTCEDGYLYDKTTKVCKCSADRCTSCEMVNSQFVCIQCQAGYQYDSKLKSCECIFPNKGKCEMCPKNYMFDYSLNQCACQDNICELCDSVDGSKCKQCKKGYQYDQIAQTCKRDCTQGYKLIKNKCECEDSNCIDCSVLNGKICLQCLPDYEINPSTSQCECRIQNCTSCSNNTCAQCKLGYIVENNQCKCNINQCKTCSDSNDGRCLVCIDGYQLSKDEKSCNSTDLCKVDKCSLCETANTCIECQLGYQLSSEKECIISEEKYIFKTKQSLMNYGYLINLDFEIDLLKDIKIELKDALSFTISNVTNYVFEIVQTGSKQVQIKIKMQEDCKKQKIHIQIASEQFYSINKLKKREDSLDLDTFVIVTKEQKEEIEKVKNTTKILTYSTLGVASMLTVLGGFFLLFGALDVSAYIYYIFFVNVRFPYNVVKFSRLFVEFQFNFIPNIFLPIIDKSYNQQSPSKFMENDTDSYFIKNAGRFLFIICIIIAIYGFLKLLSITPLGKLQRYLANKVSNVWEFNAFISVFWFVYIYLSVSCFLQFKIFEIHDSTSYFNYALVFLTFIFLIGLPILLTKVLYNTDSPTTDQLIQTKFYFLIATLACSSQKFQNESCFEKLFSKDHQKVSQDENSSPPLQASKSKIMQTNSSPEIQRMNTRLGSVTLTPLDITGKYSLIREMNKYTLVLQFYRKLMFSLLIVYLHDYSQTQLVCISFMNGYFALYYLFAQPFGTIFDNIKSCLTEIIFIIIHALIVVLKQDDDREIQRINIGWGIIAMCILALSLQLIGMVIQLINKIKDIKSQQQSKLNKAKTLPLQAEADDVVNKINRQQTEITSLQYKIPYLSNQNFSSQAQMVLGGNQQDDVDNQNIGIEGLTQLRKGRRIRNFTNLIFNELNVMRKNTIVNNNNSTTLLDQSIIGPLSRARSSACTKASLDDSPIKTQSKVDLSPTKTPKKQKK